MQRNLLTPCAGQQCVFHWRTVRDVGHMQHNHGRQPFNTSQRSPLTKASKDDNKHTLVGLLDQSDDRPLLQDNGDDTREPLLSTAVSPPAHQQKGQSDWSDIKLYKGTKIAPAVAAAVLGLALRYLAPIPEGLNEQSWSLLALFVTIISGLVLGPLPTGAWAFLGATVGLATHTLTFHDMFSAANNTVVWLVVVSFFLAKGFEKTGLGERIASQLLTICGSNTLGLAVGLSAAEALLTPAVASTTSRAAGIFMPVITSVSQAAGSLPGEASRKKLGAFLTQSQFQASSQSSNLVMTAAAQNLLCLQLATSIGVNINDPFMTWLTGSCVPATLGVLLMPCLLYWLWPPTIRSTPEAPAAAAARLREMGPMSADEKIMAGAISLAVALWVFGGQIGVEPVVASMLALSVLLLSGVLKWQDCLACTPAWDTLVWFTVLISMSLGLQSLGVIDVFSSWAGGQLTTLDLPLPALFGLLHLLFFAMHYLFASQTAHVGALYTAFCSLMISAGVPPQLAAMSLAYNVNLFGSLTHYASGQAAVYVGPGFLKNEDVFVQGAACAVASLLLWSSVGMMWWSFLGWY